MTQSSQRSDAREPMTLLIDDRTLSACLQGDRPTADSALFTTGLWYVRLCQAVFTPGRPAEGQLSKPIASLPPSKRAAALRALLNLPDDIGLLSMRELGPTIAELRGRHTLNLLAIEALAAASLLQATVVLSVPSPGLEQALADEGLSWSRRST